MTFTFGFTNEPAVDAVEPSTTAPNQCVIRETVEIPWDSVSAGDELVDLLKVKGHQGRVLELQKVRATDGGDSDLISGKYEGGLKLWECSLDLVTLLDAPQWREDSLRGAKVIELGCGHGLPALSALHFGASCVHFQDYDREVVQKVTIPNARIGGYPLVGTDSVKFFAGDWGTLVDTLPSDALESYDLILSAETIYSIESLPRLARCLVALLKPGSGTALIAAKRYYFGVGGGFAAFEREVEKAAAAMNKTIKTEPTPLVVIQDGQSNLREIRALSVDNQSTQSV